MDRSELRFDVFNSDRVYVGSTVNAEEACCLVSFLGDGSIIKYNDNIVWKEGLNKGDSGFAADSYDIATELIWENIEQKPKGLRVV